MFEQLSALFGSRKSQLSREAEATKNRLVEAAAKGFGLSLAPAPAPSRIPGDLTPAEFRAFECAFEALLERMVRGASGLAPDFGELERMAISHIKAAGWRQSASALSDLSLAACATVASLAGYDRRLIFGSFDAAEMDAIKQSLVKLRSEENTAETTVRQQLFTHPACADAFVHLYWRDRGHRTHTYFNIVLGFGARFAEAMTEAMLADVVFQTFRRTFTCKCFPDRLVTGGISFQRRDGIVTDVSGLILSEQTSGRLAGEGLNLPQCLLAISMYERLL